MDRKIGGAKENVWEPTKQCLEKYVETLFGKIDEVVEGKTERDIYKVVVLGNMFEAISEIYVKKDQAQKAKEFLRIKVYRESQSLLAWVQTQPEEI